MKILSLIFTAMLCFAVQNSYSQETVKDSAYIADYNKLHSLHIKEINSNTYIEFMKYLDHFLDKTNGKLPKDIDQPNDIIKWIEENIEQTDFLSFTEAEFEWGIVTQLQAENIKQNQNFYSFMMQITLKYDNGIDMIMEEMLNLEKEFPK